MILEPNRNTFDDLIALVKQGDYGAEWGWMHQGVGTCGFDKGEDYLKAYGAATIQGLVFYYFTRKLDQMNLLDGCVYDNLRQSECDNYGDKVHVVHFTLCGKPWWDENSEEVKKSKLCMQSRQKWRGFYDEYRRKVEAKGISTGAILSKEEADSLTQKLNMNSPAMKAGLMQTMDREYAIQLKTRVNHVKYFGDYYCGVLRRMVDRPIFNYERNVELFANLTAYLEDMRVPLVSFREWKEGGGKNGKYHISRSSGLSKKKKIKASKEH